MIYQYPKQDLFESWDKPDFAQFSGNIVLWGAGRIGGVAEYCLRKRGVQISAFCDIASDKWGTTFCGCKVISPEELKKQYPDAAIVVSTVYHNSIYPILIDSGFQRVFDCTSLFMEIDFDGYDFWMTPEYSIRNVEQYLSSIWEQRTHKSSIDQIFLNITTKCTLRCKHCSLFIPYVSNPCNYPAEEIMQDLQTVLDVIGHVRVVNFYGGEPLLHPDLSTMIRKLVAESRIDRISIITNGTIVPNSDLIRAMQEEPRFWVRISDYGVLSSQRDALINTLENNKITYEITNYSYWDESSKVGDFYSSEDSVISKFRHCTACNFLFMLNRKVYLCSTASAICNMKVFPPSSENYVDLSDSQTSLKDVGDRLLDYIGRSHERRYLDACKYCSGNPSIQFEHKVPVAEQTKELLTFAKLY